MCLCLGNSRNLKNSVAVLNLGGESLQITYFPKNNKEIPLNTNYIKKYTIMGIEREIYKQRYVKKEKGERLVSLCCSVSRHRV